VSETKPIVGNTFVTLSANNPAITLEANEFKLLFLSGRGAMSAVVRRVQ
jgi:hypothetical protein